MSARRLTVVHPRPQAEVPNVENDAGLPDGSGPAHVRFLGVARGDPFGRLSYSGINYHLFRALLRRGALATAVDAGPDRLTDAVTKALVVHPEAERWRQRHLVSLSLRRQLSRSGARRARPHLVAGPDVLQIGAWYDLSSLRPGARSLSSYNDGTTADMILRPDLAIPRDAAMVRRVLRFERRVADGLDVIFTVSDRLRRAFVEELGQPPEKVVTAWAGANVTIPDEVPPRPADPPRFLFVGKQFARKGGDTLLRAFAEVRRRRPDAELVIVGPVRLPVTPGPGVRFEGLVDRSRPGGDARIDGLYREATAYVMPSVFDPFPIVFFEAMAYRLPCIASTAGALPEIVADGENGFTVPPGDVERLADRMLRLADDPALAVRMGEAGHRRLRERFTWDAVAGRMVEGVGAHLARSGGSASWAA